jgi:hypothetical protein
VEWRVDAQVDKVCCFREDKRIERADFFIVVSQEIKDFLPCSCQQITVAKTDPQRRELTEWSGDAIMCGILVNS